MVLGRRRTSTHPYFGTFGVDNGSMVAVFSKFIIIGKYNKVHCHLRHLVISNRNCIIPFILGRSTLHDGKSAPLTHSAH